MHLDHIQSPPSGRIGMVHANNGNPILEEASSSSISDSAKTVSSSGPGNVEAVDGDAATDDEPEGNDHDEQKKPQKISERKRRHDEIMSICIRENAWKQETKVKGEGNTIREFTDEELSINDLMHRKTDKKIIETPREYQMELFERAKQQNTIAVLDTGSGKTLIAALLIRWMLDEELKHRRNGGSHRIIFFVVGSVALTFQQHGMLSCNLDQPLAQLYGDMNVDQFSAAHWAKIFRENKGVVCTAEVLYQCLNKSFIKMSDINLLVFDEAHHAKKDHSFSQIMKQHYHRAKAVERPRIFGMTASPVDAKTDVVQAARDLETLLDSQIATARDTALLRTAVSRPAEYVVYYHSRYNECGTTSLTSKLRACLGKTAFFKELISKAEKFRVQLGNWCCDRYWELAFRDEAGERVESEYRRTAKRSGVVKTLDVRNRELGLIKAARSIVKEHAFHVPESAEDSLWTDKVDKLRKLLDHEFGQDNTSRCIVFVAHRGMAFLLTDIFQHIGPPHLRAAAMVGTRQTEIGEISYSLATQIRTLNKFEKGAYNCIFATTIAEEGLDVADCNVIIRFDLYNTMIQYVQSRGRARHGNSRYYHMIEAGNNDHEDRLALVRQSEEAMRSFCQALPEDRLLKGNEGELEALTRKQKGWLRHPIKETGALLDYHSSLVCLHHYLDVLSQSTGVSHGTILQPTYVMSTSVSNFRFEVVLPDPCPVRSIMGKEHSTKMAAKRSAAFMACIELLKAGHLDNNLMPNLERANHALRNAHLAVGQKKTRYDMISKPTFWSKTWGKPVEELYITILNVAHPDACGQPHSPVAMLTRRKLPTIPTFPIFPRPEIRTDATFTQLNLPLTYKSLATDGTTDSDALVKFQSAIGMLTKFTLCVFTDLFNKTYEYDESRISYWLAPVNTKALLDIGADAKAVIDWDLLDKVSSNHLGFAWRTQFTRTVPRSGDRYFDLQEWMTTVESSQGPENNALSKTLEPGRYFFNGNDLIGRFLVDTKDGSRRYLVEASAEDLSPTSRPPIGVKPLKGGAAYTKFKETILGYTASGSAMQRQKILDDAVPDQPVLKAFALSHKRNLLIPWSETDRKDTAGNIVGNSLAYVCPDSLRVSALPANIVALLWNLPPFIFRIEAHLIAQEACDVLGLTIDPALALEALTKDNAQAEDGSEILDSQHGMGRNYERLEFIGDCFLKMATSISLHTINATDTEFFSHCNRMEMICNKNLCTNSIESMLYKYIRVGAMNRRVWYPEGLKLLHGRAVKTAEGSTADTAMLGDKTIADVCEALIGAALLTYRETKNVDMAMKAVTATVKNKNHDFEKWSDYYAQYEKPQWQTATSDAVTLELARMCRSKDNYAFRHPALLYSAFKHPSLPFSWDHIPDYQRLEFLGDGLYDMACVNFLYERYTDKGPQWLTEHKMAMVNNKFLGFICVKLKFHVHLRHNNNSVGSQIKRYVDEMTDDNGNVACDPDAWNRKGNQPPKCLPDMVEAYMGALFVDSEYNFGEIERFFDEHVKEHFENMTLYDDFARGHPVTALQWTLVHEYGCQDFSITGKPVPKLPGDIGDERYLSVVLIHDQVGMSNFGKSPRYGKTNVANKMSKKLEDMTPSQFRMQFKCDCEQKRLAGEKPGLPHEMQIGTELPI